MKLITALFMFLSVFSALACPGGFLKLRNDSVLLTADRARADFGMLDVDMTTQEMLEGSRVLEWSEGNGYVRVEVLFVKADAGGVLFAIYRIQTKNSNGDVTDEKITKIKSNYVGNGIRAKGISIDPEFEVDEEIGCH